MKSAPAPEKLPYSSAEGEASTLRIRIPVDSACWPLIGVERTRNCATCICHILSCSEADRGGNCAASPLAHRCHASSATRYDVCSPHALRTRTLLSTVSGLSTSRAEVPCVVRTAGASCGPLPVVAQGVSAVGEDNALPDALGDGVERAVPGLLGVAGVNMVLMAAKAYGASGTNRPACAARKRRRFAARVRCRCPFSIWLGANS
ncbi:uncharacterized protein B0H18DRAFT_1011109 [Fomitopsis serialis]|uniref:uncharacterized protein n=1 Tax=Fomitopsis serialis TaxID=139415 RepID=UPI0020074B13|nr:uncharacterized protein B0H18DRAFT_1011109 [Neoantrodia serialis]KAH9924766.1 hypothetical protein B0H18DRAFT_1011109 [Neoantrodia serialis]